MYDYHFTHDLPCRSIYNDSFFRKEKFTTYDVDYLNLGELIGLKTAEQLKNYILKNK